MALNLGASGADFTPSIKWMAQTSAWEISNDGVKKNVALNEAVFDMEGLKTGWCCFKLGQAPQWVMDASMSQQAARPSDEKDADNKFVWKRGFRVVVYSPSTFGGDGMREFATSATGACMGVDALHDQYEAQKGANAGKVPVVKYNGPLPTKVGKGSTNIPQLAITKWIDRPAALGASQPAPAANVTPVHQPNTVQNNVAAQPAQQQGFGQPAAAAAQAASSISEF